MSLKDSERRQPQGAEACRHRYLQSRDVDDDRLAGRVLVERARAPVPAFSGERGTRLKCSVRTAASVSRTP